VDAVLIEPGRTAWGYYSARQRLNPVTEEMWARSEREAVYFPSFGGAGGFRGHDGKRARYTCPECRQKFSVPLSVLVAAAREGRSEVTLPLRFDGRLTAYRGENRPRRFRASKRVTPESPS
jgi:hypothetical protein